MSNLFATPIPANDLKKIVDLVQQAITIARPYLSSLTPDERQKMLKMGDKTVAFVQKVADYAANNPGFVPAFVDLAEFNSDTAALTGLTPLHQLLEAFVLDADSTMMLAGSDAYAAALIIYNNIKFLAKNKQPGAQAAYDDLSQRFPGSSNAGRKTKPLQST